MLQTYTTHEAAQAVAKELSSKYDTTYSVIFISSHYAKVHGVDCEGFYIMNPSHKLHETMTQVKLKKLNAGSSRYGVCEVCKKPADITYWCKDKSNPIIFGHLECLRIYFITSVQ